MDSLKILNTLTRAVFPEIEYLEWVSGRPEEAVYDLGSSGLGKRYDGVLPSPLEDLEDPSPETDLEDQIAEEYDVPDENVLVTAGASHANFMIASISLDRGSTVLVEKPGYEPLVATPRGLGANVRRFNRPKDEDYTIGIEEVKGKINDDTCLITVTNRHNPSGRLVERDALRKLAEVAEDHDAYLLVDEVYVPYVSQPKTDTALGSVTGAGLPNTIVTNSLTKFYGLGEIRIGWAIAKDDIIQKLSSVSAHVPTVARTSVSMAERVLQNHDEVAEMSRSIIRRNNPLLSSFVEERDDIEGFISPGNTFGFLSHKRASGDEVTEAAWENDVLVVPGRFFDSRDSFRISAGKETQEVREGLKVLGDTLDSL